MSANNVNNRHQEEDSESNSVNSGATGTLGDMGSVVPLTVIPHSAPDTVTIPDVWDLPQQGSEWCECGGDCTVDRETAIAFARMVVGDREWITHEEVIMIAMDVWSYISVCEFFMMAIREAAEKVNGSVEDKYKFETGLAIIGYFSKHWNGCPEQACAGGVFDR